MVSPRLVLRVTLNRLRTRRVTTSSPNASEKVLSREMADATAQSRKFPEDRPCSFEHHLAVEVRDKMRVAVYARVSATDSRVTRNGRNSATAMMLTSRGFSQSADVTVLTTFGSMPKLQEVHDFARPEQNR